VLKSIVLAPSDADVKAEVSAWAEPVPTLRVGFFGICTEHTPQLSFPGPTVVFDDAVRHARAMVEQLQVAGADVVIALTHLKLVSDVELLKAVPGIALLGGHDHFPHVSRVDKAWLVKCGENAESLGVLDISVELGDAKK